MWGTRVAEGRAGAIKVALAIALAAASALVVSATVSRALRGSAFDGLLVAAISGLCSVALVQLGVRLADRTLFPARAAYRKAVQQISEALASTTNEQDVAVAVHAAVRSGLRCRLVDLTLDGDPTPAAAAATLPRGAAELEVPISFDGQRLGRIRVGEKGGAALFNSEDQALLWAIAGHAALGLAHARRYREIQRRRRDELAAHHSEKALIVDTLGAEIAHEIRYPINFFRAVLGAAASLGPEDAAIGLEEVDRLDRMVASLERMAGAEAAGVWRTTDVRELIGRAESLLRDRLGPKRMERSIAGPTDVYGNPDQLLQILMNLLCNAVEATAGRSGGRLGVDWVATPDRAELRVWDDGPGPGAPAQDLFAAWFTTKPNGTGLGLAIARRLADAHNFGLRCERRDGRTTFALLMPAPRNSHRGAA